MKKIILTMCFIVFCGACFADESVPVLRPSAPDVPNLAPATGSDYLPNVIKQYEDTKVNQPESDVIEDAEELIDEVDNKVQQTTEEIKDAVQEKADEIFEDGFNPINTDATNENIQNKNFVPVKEGVNEAAENTKKAVKEAKKEAKKAVKNAKKEKPKYGKYKGVAEDEYIQEWEEESSKYTTVEDAVNAEKENLTPPKTYTQDDYEQIYRDLQVPEFKFVHGIDPDQYYDMKDTTWSPYPLLRLNSPLYFKTITIEPGYYLLTPREYKGDWYILFKEAGTVKYTIPAFAKGYTPEFYYRDNLKELDMNKSQRWQIKFLNAWGKYVRKSKRKPATKTNVELTDLDNNFLLIDLYYGAHKYSTIFRIEKF